MRPAAPSRSDRLKRPQTWTLRAAVLAGLHKMKTLAFLLTCSLAWAQEPQISPGSFTLVHIPDTQNYVSDAGRALIANRQMEWIKSQKVPRNIRCAVQVGDLVNDNDNAQWDRVRAAFDILRDEVPLALSSGNHDCGPAGSGHTRVTQFSQSNRFGPGSPYAAQASVQGFFQHPNDTLPNSQNAWHTFKAGPQEYLVLTCEWGPRNKVVEWMNRVVESHPWHRVILVVHAYLDSGTARLNWLVSPSGMNPHSFGIASDPDGVNDGQDLWEKLVKKHENFCLVCCGHAGRGFRTAIGDKGNRVHEMLFNTQEQPNGGDGWLRLLEFLPDNRTVKASTYSTLHQVWDNTPAGSFQITLSPVSSTDTDADGMPDYFEYQNGWRLENPANAAADSDHDGVSNLAEFLACTSPLDSSSRMEITSVALQPATATLEWKSVPGMRYRVEECQWLGAQPNWSGVGDVQLAASYSSRLTFPCTGTRKFFRVSPVP